MDAILLDESGSKRAKNIRRVRLQRLFNDCLVTLAALLIISSACDAHETPDLANGSEPNIVIQNTYYEITGTTADELRSQMNRLGPLDESGHRHDAYTEWYVEWSYPNSIVSGNCTTGPIEVTVIITSTFPKRDPPPEASDELIGKWTAYINALQKHENNHKMIAIETGNDILRTLNTLPAYSSCEELEKIADTTAQDILEQSRQKEIDYDQATDHGASQGARFP